ncbi:MAG: soluble lytic murein transglycosylase-like protein [Glaciecola sp.]|jgi:soluble lytic murein transglycosylase-like protein
MSSSETVVVARRSGKRPDPGTAAGLGVDPWNPYENLDGARYLRAQIERFGQADLGLAAGNAGPGRMQRAGDRILDIVETQISVLRILERWERLRNAA